MALPALVLVHGGGLAGDSWELTIDEIHRLAPELAVLAVDLPGRRGKPGDLVALTIADCVESVVDDIEHAGLDTIVLVGHSMAGPTVPGVAATLGPSRVRELVLATAFVPPEGKSLVDTLTGPFARVARRNAKKGGLSQTSSRRNQVCLPQRSASSAAKILGGQAISGIRPHPRGKGVSARNARKRSADVDTHPARSRPLGEVSAQGHRGDRRYADAHRDGYLSLPDGQRAGTAGRNPRRALSPIRIGRSNGGTANRSSAGWTIASPTRASAATARERVSACTHNWSGVGRPRASPSLGRAHQRRRPTARRSRPGTRPSTGGLAAMPPSVRSSADTRC